MNKMLVTVVTLEIEVSQRKLEDVHFFLHVYFILIFVMKMHYSNTLNNTNNSKNAVIPMDLCMLNEDWTKSRQL